MWTGLHSQGRGELQFLRVPRGFLKLWGVDCCEPFGNRSYPANMLFFDLLFPEKFSPLRKRMGQMVLFNLFKSICFCNYVSNFSICLIYCKFKRINKKSYKFTSLPAVNMVLAVPLPPLWITAFVRGYIYVLVVLVMNFCRLFECLFNIELQNTW